MKFKPTTLALVLTALIMGGAVYFTQRQGASQTSVSDAEGQKLFQFEENQVTSFTLKTQLRSLVFEKDSSGNWQMKEPDQVRASDASIAYLLNLIVTARSDRTITAPAADQEEFSFHQPMATVNLKLDNQETHRLIVGGYDFNRASLYAQADPSDNASEDLKVFLVSPDFDNAVNRPFAEWKASSDDNQNTEASPSPDASPQETSPSPDASP